MRRRYSQGSIAQKSIGNKNVTMPLLHRLSFFRHVLYKIYDIASILWLGKIAKNVLYGIFRWVYEKNLENVPPFCTQLYACNFFLSFSSEFNSKMSNLKVKIWGCVMESILFTVARESHQPLFLRTSITFCFRVENVEMSDTIYV